MSALPNENFPTDRREVDAQNRGVGGEQATEPTNVTAIPNWEPPARSTVPPAPTKAPPTANMCASALADPFLYLQAQVVDDLERTRIANENRLRQLLRGGPDDPRIKSGKYATVADLPPDKDGEERGFGLPLSDPDVARLAGIVDALTTLEHGAELNLKRALRKHPLGTWVKSTVGVGEKQGARLLAAIGDPYVNTLHDRPRTVSELWAYCGLHTLPAGQTENDAQHFTAGGGQAGDPGQMSADAHAARARVAAKRRKGQKANWSADAKSRAYLIATSCIKQAASPYRSVYDDRRAHTASTHPEWTLGHSHNDGVRIVSKRILRDLWRAARDIHQAAQP